MIKGTSVGCLLEHWTMAGGRQLQEIRFKADHTDDLQLKIV